MNIIVKGFKDQSIVTISELLAMVEVIPVHHKQHIRNIVYDPNRFYQRSYASPKPLNRRVAAEYNRLPFSYVVVYKFTNKEQLRHMLYHEIGHHVYHQVLNSVQKKTWVTELYSAKKFISDYAKTNASEDFAETYSYFFHSPTTCAKLTDKYNFIRNI